MKIIHWIFLSFLLLAGLPSRARADRFRTDINPALIYYQAFLLEPHVTDTDHDYLLTNDWRGQPLVGKFATLITNYDTEMNYLRRAAAQTPPCDWGIDLSPGPETLLPQLAHCKQAVLAARLHAMWNLKNGDEAAARDDLLGALALGRNSARDGSLIAVLVQIATEGIVLATVAENFQHFSPATLQQFAHALDGPPARRTLASCLQAGRLIDGNWLIAQLQDLQKMHPGDDAAVIAGLHQKYESIPFGSEGTYWQQLTNDGGGTVAGLIHLAHETESWYQQLSEIMTLPHGPFEEQLKQFLDAAKKSGQFMFFDSPPPWPSVRRKEFAIETALAMTRAAIAYKLHGEEGLNNVTDPCGNGPFKFERFIFQGEDRGFQLKSTYVPGHKPLRMIFVEKDGPPFHVIGDLAGEPITP
jgi:hypothetical protein